MRLWNVTPYHGRFVPNGAVQSSVLADKGQVELRKPVQDVATTTPHPIGLAAFSESAINHRFFDEALK